MIDPNWTVIDLDPHTWRNLGRFLEPPQYVRTSQPGEHGLFILHDEGRPLNVYDSQRGSRPELVAGSIDNPQLLAHDLFETGEWDRVHVINKRHLAEVAFKAQTIENRALTLDAYYHRVFELVWKNPQGYVSLPPHPGHWNHWTYRQAKEFVDRLPDPASLALAVLDNDRVTIGLILEVRGGLIRLVTTFEALALESPLTLSTEAFENLWAAVARKFAPPAGILLCDQATFEALLTAQDKSAFFAGAAHNQTFFYRLTVAADK